MCKGRGHYAKKRTNTFYYRKIVIIFDVYFSEKLASMRKTFILLLTVLFLSSVFSSCYMSRS